MALRVAVAGLGGRGRDWIREVRADPSFELAACADTDAGALRLAADALDIPEEMCFADLETALERTRCDAVIVATSADCHVAPCETALERGLPVLVEKPFTLRVAEAIRLVELAERRSAPLMVGQNYRYMRANRAARRLVQRGALGRVGQVVSQYYRVPHDMSPSLARSEHSVLLGASVHHLDALRFVLGDEVVGVAAQSFTAEWGDLPRGASFQALLAFAGGARAMCSGTYESSGHEFFERGQEFYQRYVGERATLHVFHRWLLLAERGKLPRPVRRGPRRQTEERVLLEQLRRAVADGVPPQTSGRDNLQTVALLDACIRSAEEQRWINPQDLLAAGG